MSVQSATGGFSENAAPSQTAKPWIEELVDRLEIFEKRAANAGGPAITLGNVSDLNGSSAMIEFHVSQGWKSAAYSFVVLSINEIPGNRFFVRPTTDFFIYSGKSSETSDYGYSLDFPEKGNYERMAADIRKNFDLNLAARLNAVIHQPALPKPMSH